MLGGRRVTRFKKGAEQYDVIVQIADDARRTPEDLSNIFVRGGDGGMVQLDNLATVRETVAAKELNHFNKLRSATISVGLAPGYSQGAGAGLDGAGPAGSGARRAVRPGRAVARIPRVRLRRDR